MEKASSENAPPELAQLKRVLGRWDLVAFFVVAVFNLNVVPSIAANGGSTIWLWLVSMVLFLIPQAIAVIELSHHYPGEGGVYLWTKKYFGDFHGFLSGWCYWTNNMLYVPTIMLYFVGVSVFVLGPGHQHLADNKAFAVTVSLLLLAILVAVNIVGTVLGKWLSNISGVVTAVATVTLVSLGAVVCLRHGTALTAADFRIPSDIRSPLNSFGVICYGLVGLELASIMGDEIREPRRVLPFAVTLGGVVAGLLYIVSTLTMLAAVDKKDINVIQGVVQAVGLMSNRVGIGWLATPFALMLSISIAGIGSVWLAGSARIPFVAGLDAYLPAWLGKVHPRWHTPAPAILVHGAISAVLILINSFGAGGVQEMFQKLLALSVVLNLIPFLYIFGAVLKVARRPEDGNGIYSRAVLLAAGTAGFVTTAVGIAMVFFPAKQIESFWLYEAWMFGGTAFFVGLAAFFFYRRVSLSPIPGRVQG
ncbi:MAG: APC family permease [Elusimicrobia bacterium]|nr:APC family permease [Elusimicrobiota bacterium]